MNKENNNEGANVAWAILGFFFPLIGLIIFIIWLANNNNNSKYIGLGALAGFIVRVVAIIELIIAVRWLL